MFRWCSEITLGRWMPCCPATETDRCCDRLDGRAPTSKVRCSRQTHLSHPLRSLKGGVRAYAFDHLLEPCPDFEPWVESRRVSPYLDVAGGLDGYLGRASRSGKDNMAQARRRSAKAEREYGAVRFVAESVDSAMLDRVIQLKRAQYAATAVQDYFAEDDRRLLLEKLLHTRGSASAASCRRSTSASTLWRHISGCVPVSVLHWWFPVYEPDFGRFAPRMDAAARACPGRASARHHPDRFGPRR